MSSDILIVGAGPTGLWLALELRSAGLTVTVVERNLTRDIRSRAAAMAAGSLETFATRGISQRFVDAGVPIHSVHFGSSPTRLQMSRDILGTKHPHSMMIPQATTEQLLTDICQLKGVKFYFGHEAVGLIQDNQSVTLSTVAEDGSNPKLTASWLVGADGTRSSIRRMAEFDFPGSEGTITGWLADVLLEDPPTGPVSVNNEAGSFLVQPLGFEKYYRATGLHIGSLRLPPSATPTLDDVKQYAMESVGKDYGMHSPLWFSRFGNATRLASNFRKGRIFIAGDAAHQFFPAGGQGVTTGLGDAANLAWKLAAVVKGKFGWSKSEALLNSYSKERRLALEAIIKSTLAQTALYIPDTPQHAALADVVYELIKNPDSNTMWVRRITGFSDPFPTYEAGQDALIGARVTHLEVGGSFDGLHAAMGVESFVLVVRNPDLEAPLKDCTRPWIQYINTLTSRDKINAWGKQWDGVEALLLRPDARVAWVWRASSPLEKLKSSIAEVLARLCKEITDEPVHKQNGHL